MSTRITSCGTGPTKFGCSDDELKAVVAKVGVMAKDVEAESSAARNAVQPYTDVLVDIISSSFKPE